MILKEERMNLIVKSLINIINNPKANHVDRYIASQMIQNYQEIYHMSILEMSHFLNVSNSQISRFVRSIGFESYSQFKDSLSYHGDIHRHLDIHIKETISYSSLKNNIIEEIRYFFEHFDMSQLFDLIQDLHQYKHVAFFGLLNSGNVARDIQMNLASQGLISVSYSEISDQLEFIKNANHDTLVIVISVSGDYILGNDYSRYYKVQNIFKHSHAKKIMITRNTEIKQLDMIDKVIILPIHQNYYNHTLQCFVDLLTMYYHKFPKDGNIMEVA